MRILHLIRHAKSSWQQPQLADHQRPLNNRGLRSCVTMGTTLSHLNIHVSVCFVSSAKRAQQTYQGLKHGFAHDSVMVTDELYTFSVNKLEQFIKQISDQHQAVIIIGHNPAFCDLINYSDSHANTHFPTCGLASLQLPVPSWQNYQHTTSQLIRLITPKSGQII